MKVSKVKVYCPVCQVTFAVDATEEMGPGTVVICTVCGAKLELTSDPVPISDEHGKANKKDQGSRISIDKSAPMWLGAESRKYPQEPETEIRERVDTFARLRDYTFNEDKEDLIQGLLEKYRMFGDFYCPCKLDNIPENLCPCQETRQNFVKKYGYCY